MRKKGPVLVPLHLTDPILRFHVEFPATYTQSRADELVYNVQDALVSQGPIVDRVVFPRCIDPANLWPIPRVIRTQIKYLPTFNQEAGPFDKFVCDPPQVIHFITGEDIFDRDISVLTVKRDLFIIQHGEPP